MRYLRRVGNFRKSSELLLNSQKGGRDDDQKEAIHTGGSGEILCVKVIVVERRKQ